MYPDRITGLDTEGRLVEIEINDADYREEHLRLGHLMALVGYVQRDIDVTQEDFKCFSAVHTYAKI